MNNLEKEKEEGKSFIERGYADLPEVAKMNVNAYMRGIKDGMAFALAQQNEHPTKQSVI